MSVSPLYRQAVHDHLCAACEERHAEGGTRRRGDCSFAPCRPCAVSPRLFSDIFVVSSGVRPWRYLILLLLLAFALAACDNSFEPINADPTDFFAVFGYLDTAADTQFVRVSPLREALEPSGERPVRVSTLRLGTGAEVAWRDSLVRLDDGQTGLLFYAQLPVGPGDSYQLDVEGAEGEVTRAVTQVPLRVRLDTGPVMTDFNDRLAQRVTLLGQQRVPRRLNIRYRVTPPGATDTVTVTLPLFVFSGSASGIEVRVPLETDRAEVLRRLHLLPLDSTVVLHSLGLEIEQLSDEWETPEAAVNIENGFGFFGSVAHYVLTWTLEAADVRALGYRPPE